MPDHHFVTVARIDDIAPGKKLLIEVADKEVLLCNDDGTIYAVAALCSHAEQSLECGLMRNGWIACPIHGARFDLETGLPINPPASAPIATYPVRIENGAIAIAV